MIDLASLSLSDAAKEPPSSFTTRYGHVLRDLTRNADRVFYFDEGPRAEPKFISKAYQ